MSNYQKKIAFSSGECQDIVKNSIFADDGAGREREVASPKEQVAKAMNLSGKETRIGRNSGERYNLQPPKGIAYTVVEPSIRVTFRCKDRESYNGIRLSFFYAIKRLITVIR